MGELSLPLLLNKQKNSYGVLFQHDIETKKISNLLREIHIGVELFTLYKQLPIDIQTQYYDVIEDRVSSEKYDESWWEICRIFGVKRVSIDGETIEI